MAAVILIALVIYGYESIKADNGSYAVITVNGRETEKLSLSKDTEVDVYGFNNGYNHVIVKDGYCYVSDSDCPDHLCEMQGQISKDGEAIICLPHRVVVTIEGGDRKDSDVDAITK